MWELAFGGGILRVIFGRGGLCRFVLGVAGFVIIEVGVFTRLGDDMVGGVRLIALT